MSMLKIFDNVFKNRIDISFIKKEKINGAAENSKYQIVEICQQKKYNEQHILFSVHFTPLNFKKEFRRKLNPNKKIVIVGQWQRNAQYYRVLKHNGFRKVYLVK